MPGTRNITSEVDQESFLDWDGWLFTDEGEISVKGNQFLILVIISGLILILCLGCTIYLLFKCLRNPFLRGYGKVGKDSSGTSSSILDQMGDFPFPSPMIYVESPIPSSSTSSFTSSVEQKGRRSRRAGISSKNTASIVTPDKSIPFFIPTISLATQGTTGDYYDSSDQPQMMGAISRNIYYPQLEAEDPWPKLEFSLFYDCPNQLFYVRLHSGLNFPTDIFHYIQVKVFPSGGGRSGGRQRTDEFKSESPILANEFIFHVRRSVLHTKVLKIRAMGVDKYLLGSINIAVKDIRGFERENPEESIRTGHLWKRFEPPGGTNHSGGNVELQLGLRWDTEPVPGLLTLRIIEAFGLHDRADEKEYTSTYVKVILEEDGKRIKSRKTRTIRWGSLPKYEESFVVTIPQVLLSRVSFSLILVGRGKLGTKEVLGRVVIGPIPYASSSSAGAEFWADMIHSPNKEQIKLIPLNSY